MTSTSRGVKRGKCLGGGQFSRGLQEEVDNLDMPTQRGDFQGGPVGGVVYPACFFVR